MSIVSSPDHGDKVVNNGVFSVRMQSFVDDLVLQLNNRLLGQSVKLQPYTVATLPNVLRNTNGLIIVTDETGGFVTAFSDGTNWRRTTDRAIVS